MRVRLKNRLNLKVFLAATAVALAAGPFLLTAPAAAEEQVEGSDDFGFGEPVVYTPPVQGAPGDRIGAGTRNSGRRVGRVLLLAPKGGGLTVSEAPRLYWWLAERFKGDIEIRLQGVGAERPLMHLKRALSSKPGLQVLDLDQLGLKLRKDKIYHWTIMLHASDGRRWGAGTTYIERKNRSIEPKADNDAVKARNYAAAGYWYDALALLAENPKHAKLRKGLLDSAGLRPEIWED